MAAWSVPGLSLAIVEDGKVSVTRGYGVANREQATPMTPQTLVAVGSTTKSVTALAVLQLVEQGNVDLDAPVTRYLPWFTLDDPALGRDHRAAASDPHGRHPAPAPRSTAARSLMRWSGGSARSSGSRYGARPAPAGSTPTTASTSPA